MLIAHGLLVKVKSEGGQLGSGVEVLSKPLSYYYPTVFVLGKCTSKLNRATKNIGIMYFKCFEHLEVLLKG